jgi:hypothetical protein
MWSAVERTLRRMRKLDGNSQVPWNQMQVNAFVAATLGGVIDEAPRHSTPHAGTGVSPCPVTSATSTGTSCADGDPLRPRDGGRGSDEVGADDGAASGWSDDPERIAHMLRSIELRAPEVTVLVDLRTLTGGLHDHSVCELEDGATLPVSTVRRLCCDAEIVPMVLGGDGEVLEAGRSRRTPSRAQRRALRTMHRTCAYPGCTVPFSHTRAHHVRFWVRDNGPTDIDNLLPLCERHHHLVHEGGWTLTMTADRVATWSRPDGSIAHRGSTIDRRPAGATRASPTDLSGSAPASGTAGERPTSDRSRRPSGPASHDGPDKPLSVC